MTDEALELNVVKIDEPLAISIPVEVYKQALFFFIDDDSDRVENWIRQRLKDDNVSLTEYSKSPTNNACAFRITNEARGVTVFVVWLKWWVDGDRSLGRLSHELIHVTADIFDYIGWTPKFAPDDTEPIAYLHESLFRDCLTAVDQWKQRAHAKAKREKHTRRIRRSKAVPAVQRADLANGGVGKGRRRSRTRRR